MMPGIAGRFRAYGGRGKADTAARLPEHPTLRSIRRDEARHCPGHARVAPGPKTESELVAIVEGDGIVGADIIIGDAVVEAQSAANFSRDPLGIIDRETAEQGGVITSSR